MDKNLKENFLSKYGIWGFLLSLLYGISPVDLLPDVIPVLGYTDDAVVILFGLAALITWMRRKKS